MLKRKRGRGIDEGEKRGKCRRDSLSGLRYMVRGMKR